MLDDYCNKQILDEMFEGAYYVDENRSIVYWNKSAERISGYSAQDTLGKSCYNSILNHIDKKGECQCFSGCPIKNAISECTVKEDKLFLQHKDGSRLPVIIKTIPIFENGKVSGCIELFTDNISDKNQEKIEKYKSLAMKDYLTSLPNRRYVEKYLDLKLSEFKKMGAEFGVAFIDIDHFKIFNDTYGHDAGDEVLKMVSKTLNNSVRTNDLVGRWGGEEFLAIFSNINEANLLAITEQFRILVEKSVLNLENQQLKVTISLGTTMVKPDDTIESITKRADALMYQSKENGRNRCTIG